MRLIDADALNKETRKQLEALHIRNWEGIGTCLNAIHNAPTIDAEPVRHGYWKPIGARLRGGNTDSFQCSECEFLARALKAGKECGYDFCPNCGAKMGGTANKPQSVPKHRTHMLYTERGRVTEPEADGPEFLPEFYGWDANGG